MSEKTVSENTDWDLLSSVKASKRRTQVLKTLHEQPKMNGEIADELGVSTEWIRRQMKWLEKHGLVEDLTETKTNYKLYRASEKGKEMIELL
ncbi:ArsR family transcriptional regulator [Halorubrum sp. FL23]|uniref:ArsR family transcriptional regulator n=1 Tax=Halorubrum sp. FL23 TaxID=3458704 RepID=UPI0040333E0C